MKKSRKKKSDKIRIIILEGESNRHFFKQLKQTYGKNEEWGISLLKAENLNFGKINREIEASIEVLKYREVWLVMDLKTRKPGTERDFANRKVITAYYRQHVAIPEKVGYIVMVLDLECWLLLYFSKHNNTETIKDSEKKLKELMGVGSSSSKIITAKRLIQKPDFWKKLISNKDKNKSFSDFLDKAGITGER